MSWCPRAPHFHTHIMMTTSGSSAHFFPVMEMPSSLFSAYLNLIRASWWRLKMRVKSWLKTQRSKTKIMASCPITWQTDGEEMETVTDFIFLGSKITGDSDWSHEIKRHLLLVRKAMTNLDSIKTQRYHFAYKGPYSQSYGFSSSHVWIWELDHKGGWALKNWCFWTVVLENTLESPLENKIKPDTPKGN